MLTGMYQGKGGGVAARGTDYRPPSQGFSNTSNANTNAYGPRAPFINPPATNSFNIQETFQSPLQRFANSDYGRNFGTGFNLYDTAARGQQTSLQNTGQRLAGQLPLLQAGFGSQMGLARGQYNNQIAGNQIDFEGNQQNQAAYRALANINLGGYENTTGNIVSQAMQQRRAAQRDAVARGAYGNVGTGQDFTDIDTNRQYALGNAENQYLTQQNSVLRNMGELDTQAKKYQLRPQEFANQLEQTLVKLGIDQTMSLSQLMNMIGSNDFQQAALANGIIEKAMGYAAANT